jgi:hypothetical protein
VREGECFGEEELRDYARCKALEAKRQSEGKYKQVLQMVDGVAAAGEKKVAAAASRDLFSLATANSSGASTQAKNTAATNPAAQPEAEDDEHVLNGSIDPVRDFSAVATGASGAVVMVVDRADYGLLAPRYRV